MEGCMGGVCGVSEKEGEVSGRNRGGGGSALLQN